MHRRSLLVAGGVGLSTALAGCVGGSRGAGGSESDPIRLRSLDVGGSPGGRIAIRPPDTVVVLDFFATWCAPCKPEMANLRAVRSRFPPADVFMVSITQETDETAIEQFWTRYDGTWPVAIDADLEATRAYSVTGIPTVVVLAPDGTEAFRHTGLAGEERIAGGVETALDAAGGG